MIDTKLDMNNLIKTRRSVRTYTAKNIQTGDLTQIKKLMEDLEAYASPFGVPIKLHLLESAEGKNNEKLGTYGIIKNANTYIGSTVAPTDYAMESLGYIFELLVLKLTDMGIGTCWMGGTFKREAFKSAFSMAENDRFPIMTPIGYYTEKNSLTEGLMRRMVKANQRKPFEELFFNSNFETPLRKEDSGSYQDALTNVQLGPSASNKQPWRIVKDGDHFHFYEYKSPGYSRAFGYDIQRIDMGIALAHFELTLKESDITGHLSYDQPAIGSLPANIEYCFTWQLA